MKLCENKKIAFRGVWMWCSGQTGLSLFAASCAETLEECRHVTIRTRAHMEERPGRVRGRTSRVGTAIFPETDTVGARAEQQRLYDMQQRLGTDAYETGYEAAVNDGPL